MNKHIPPSAELLITTGCAHCPVMLEMLSSQIKQGKIATLSVTNITISPDKATALNVRSVPWLLLTSAYGAMILSGKYNANELENRIRQISTETGTSEAIEQFMTEGQLNDVIQAINIRSETFSHIITLMQNEDTSMHVRIGIDAILEHFTATAILKKYIPQLKELARKKNIRLQIDALHYLALTSEPMVKNFLQSQTKNPDKQIQSAATEALETLDDSL